MDKPFARRRRDSSLRSVNRTRAASGRILGRSVWFTAHLSSNAQCWGTQIMVPVRYCCSRCGRHIWHPVCTTTGTGISVQCNAFCESNLRPRSKRINFVGHTLWQTLWHILSKNMLEIFVDAGCSQDSCLLLIYCTFTIEGSLALPMTILFQEAVYTCIQ